MVEVKPFWFFVVGLVLLYLFALAVLSRRGGRHPRPAPAPSHLLGPGGTQHMLYEGFQDQFDTGAKFFMFGVDWCPHCVSAKPKFMSLGSKATIGGQDVRFEYVDAEKEKQKTAGFEISGFPTFYLVKGDQKIKYQGERSVEAWRSWLTQHLAAY